MKNKKLIIFIITILSLFVIFLLVIMCLLLNGKNNYFKFNYKTIDTLVVDNTYNKSFNEIVIKSDSSDIEIKYSNSFDIKLVIYGDLERTKVNDNNDILDIKTTVEPCFGICFNKSISKIILYLPIDYDKKISVTNNYGDVFIDSFMNSNILVNADAGDIDILGGNNVTIYNDYGDVSVKNANKLVVKESCGDIIIGKVNIVEAENNYGDIEIKEVNDYMNLVNDCGDIEISNINLKNNSSIKSNLGEIEINNTNEIYINAETDLGKVKINNNYKDSNIILDIKNDCGNIKVDN